MTHKKRTMILPGTLIRLRGTPLLAGECYDPNELYADPSEAQVTITHTTFTVGRFQVEASHNPGVASPISAIFDNIYFTRPLPARCGTSMATPLGTATARGGHVCSSTSRMLLPQRLLSWVPCCEKVP